MKLNLRQIRLAIIVLTLIMLAGGAGYRFGKTSSFKIERTTALNNQKINFSLFWDVWDRLEKAYLDKTKIRSQEMFYGAIKGMVASLDDPYTVFLPPDDNKQAKEDLNGSFEGVGIQLGYKNEQLAVISPLSGMPAEKLGVKAGDLILKIDDKETTSVTLPEAVKLIRGPKGTKVKLTLLHQNEDKPYEVTIVREAIVVPSVEVKYQGKIAQLKLTRFGDRTNDEWDKAVEEIVSNSSQGVVLDLRNNPGGYLTGSVFISSEFLPARSAGGSSGVVVQQESAKGDRETFSVNRRGKLINIPLVILVNEGSASASEIVAGALQDYGRAKIVGEKTFGKGTIQEAQDLSEGAGLHITTARWLLPKGRSIEKEGIIPDVSVVDDPKTEKDEQLEKAIEILLK